MNAKLFLAPALAVSTLGLGACAQNYGVEGAGLGAAAGAGGDDHWNVPGNAFDDIGPLR